MNKNIYALTIEVKNKKVRIAIMAKDTEEALKKFRKKYPKDNLFTDIALVDNSFQEIIK